MWYLLLLGEGERIGHTKQGLTYELAAFFHTENERFNLNQ